jgi:hypothetical protein
MERLDVLLAQARVLQFAGFKYACQKSRRAAGDDATRSATDPKSN